SGIRDSQSLDRADRSPGSRFSDSQSRRTGGERRTRCADAPNRPATMRRMLDHEEKFLFKEEILHLANALTDPGSLDNVEDLLTDVITSPRFDSEVFTLERSLQVMLGA